ncbi:MAG: sigma-70 family RNA polymerase sigma factor, partial [Planctomycetes bacterium]|nr:sigma-70 family RNA polymerase sigma factor [Planctomycetota bacterium]
MTHSSDTAQPDDDADRSGANPGVIDSRSAARASADLRDLARRWADPHRADDLVQETVLAALERPADTVRDGGAWLRGVLRRSVANLRRRERVRSAREFAAAARHPRASEDLDPVIAAERVDVVARAVAELDEPFRRVVELAYFHELEPTEIAARLGIPASTVRTRLHRSRSLLRRKLSGISAGAIFLPSAPRTSGWSWAPSLPFKWAMSGIFTLALGAAALTWIPDRGEEWATAAPVTGAPPASRIPIGLDPSPAEDAIERSIRDGLSPSIPPRVELTPRAESRREPAAPRIAARGDSASASASAPSPSPSRLPFLAHHELPDNLRATTSPDGVFFRRANGDISALTLLDADGAVKSISASDRSKSEDLLFEYDDLLVTHEAFVALGTTAAALPPTVPPDESAPFSIADVDRLRQNDGFRVHLDMHRRRIEELRQELGAARVVLVSYRTGQSR